MIYKSCPRMHMVACVFIFLEYEVTGSSHTLIVSHTIMYGMAYIKLNPLEYT